VVPEGTSLNFFTDRPNPLKEEITTPGYLDSEQQERAIRQLVDSNTRLILVANRATPEFGRGIFGRDYCERLMQWIADNYRAVATFGPEHDPDLKIGGRIFFIRAYQRKEGPVVVGGGHQSSCRLNRFIGAGRFRALGWSSNNL